jgi:photosystem II cytochrome b559 subunit alpha
MSGTTGERPLSDVVTDPQFWLLHFVNFPAVFLSGWLFVATGLAYDVFGTPRSDQYYNEAIETYQGNAPIVTERIQVKQQLDQYLQQQSVLSAPSLK